MRRGLSVFWAAALAASAAPALAQSPPAQQPAPYPAPPPYPAQGPYSGQPPYPTRYPYPGASPYPAPPGYPAPAAHSGRAPSPALAAQAGPAAPEDEARPAFGFVSDARLGFVIHDAGIFGRREEKGEDVNLELTFVSPDLLGFLWSPRPHVGVTINTGGDTSYAYAGLTWGFRFWKRFFFDFGFGLAVHDGKIETAELDRKELGSRVLFREAIDVGWNFYKRDSISFFIDHISHGNLFGDANEGLDTLGVRYIYRF